VANYSTDGLLFSDDEDSVVEKSGRALPSMSSCHVVEGNWEQSSASL
jgi:hypothetical protein